MDCFAEFLLCYFMLLWGNQGLLNTSFNLSIRQNQVKFLGLRKNPQSTSQISHFVLFLTHPVL